jgi:carbon monoxide dehydrogenase subunit G
MLWTRSFAIVVSCAHRGGGCRPVESTTVVSRQTHRGRLIAGDLYAHLRHEAVTIDRGEHTMEYSRSVDIAADPAAIWAVLRDVVTWSSWTASVESIELLGDPPLAVGSEVRIKQPGFPKAVWKVTVLDDHLFTWVSRSPGIATEGDHEVQPTESGARVTLRIRQSGPVGWLFGAVYGGRSRRYVDTEAEGLRERCQQPT